MARTSKVILYLTDWQRRMINDNVKPRALAKNYSKLILSKIPDNSWRMYIVPVLDEIKAGTWNFYLTTEQILQITEMQNIKVKFSALNITPKMIESKVVTFE